MLNNERGQSLIEVLVVLVIATVMIVALIIVILSSLKNAQFAQNQTKATKLGQDTVDKIRILRDNNKNSTLDYSGNRDCFKELWNSSSTYFDCGESVCYYLFASPVGDVLSRVELAASKENLAEGFNRQIQVTQTNDTEIKLVIQIGWTDSSGEHNSNIETFLTKPNYDCTD